MVFCFGPSCITSRSRACSMAEFSRAGDDAGFDICDWLTRASWEVVYRRRSFCCCYGSRPQLYSYLALSLQAPGPADVEPFSGGLMQQIKRRFGSETPVLPSAATACDAVDLLQALLVCALDRVMTVTMFFFRCSLSPFMPKLINRCV